MKKKNFFGRLSGWVRRVFFGGSRDLADSIDVEEVVSPIGQIVRNFLERRLAVGAMIVVILMFLLVFFGPLFMPNYYDSYTEVTQKNVAPTMSMMKVPSGLKNDIKMIDSYGSFSVGLSNSGDVYVWGATQLGTTGIDISDIPEAVENDTICYVAAGIDHIIAISESGKVYGWGSNKHGQYITTDKEVLEQLEEAEESVSEEDQAILEEAGATTEDAESVEGEESADEEVSESSDETDVAASTAASAGENIIPMPDELVNGTIDVANIKKLVCGYQCTAILMNDGKLYIWGNANAYQNISSFVDKDDLTDIDFTLNYIVGITDAGTSIYTGKRGLYDQYRSNINEAGKSSKKFLGKRKIVSIYATNNHLCGMLSDGSLFFAGNFPSDSVAMPALHDGETIVQIEAGTYHYTALTSEGRVLSWGGSTLKQTDVPTKVDGKTAKVFAGAFQSYAVDSNGSLVGKWGLKGYLFGTDGYGADIFQRIIQGGKMTMTIGAVAVIISTIIGIVVGCLSGYFGGTVDIVLMRIAEVFAAIPFLPFALILSAVMAQMDISENKKIFILMCILGVLTWTGLARMVRGQVLVARENEYVTAAKAMGVKEGRIAFRHILPNIVSIIFVTLTLDFATCMLTESSLSYLGFGVTYPRPTWGNMLSGSNNSTIIKNYWWQWVFTSIFLAVTCICINIVGDTLRDVMDPKSDRDK
ncbi:MAG: ABC transporter permease subunit [Butyrivibrio sp.]|uniref:ABC transporter permease subunit n=1 Tax=Butyrivibrio sp. TaxID=28121 RepID=UPI001B2A9249|nr:ABC transporter permease subunit [Butyrivibrio sp.]MBO6240930.1 ABC transporter permease subunit [Butyrivibrio sp.]